MIETQEGDKLAEIVPLIRTSPMARLERDASGDPRSFLPEFVPFGKIGRLNRLAIVTEKLDGTNAQIYITDDGDVMAGSRKRWISPGKTTDNYGFAAWVAEHRDELARELGPGTHFGEWWGQGIARGYGLDEKRFSLFNTERWSDPVVRPACCGVVPVIGETTTILGLAQLVDTALHRLRIHGSYAAPGFMNPEGIVIFHTARQTLFKVTLEHDELPKEVLERQRVERVQRAAA